MTEYPPKSWQDIFGYDDEDLVAGYREYCADDPEPGPNHSPAYRWGWTNRKKDATGEPDGFEAVRHDYYVNVPGLFEPLTRH